LGLLPFVVAVGQDQAAMFAVPDEAAVGGPLVKRLGARVDHLVADLQVLRPARDEAPAQEFRAPPFRVLDNRQHLLSGRNVEAFVAPFVLGWLDTQLRGELLLDLIRLAPSVREAAAHGRPTLRSASVASAIQQT